MGCLAIARRTPRWVRRWSGWPRPNGARITSGRMRPMGQICRVVRRRIPSILAVNEIHPERLDVEESERPLILPLAGPHHVIGFQEAGCRIPPRGGGRVRMGNPRRDRYDRGSGVSGEELAAARTRRGGARRGGCGDGRRAIRTAARDPTGKSSRLSSRPPQRPIRAKHRLTPHRSSIASIRSTRSSNVK